MDAAGECRLNQAAALGVKVVTPFELEIDGQWAAFTALIVDFGGSPGIVIDPDWSVREPHVEALTKAGLGYSCVRVDGGDTNDLMELLRDWTWTGPRERRPSWL
jgi:hypothetical protein